MPSIETFIVVCLAGFALSASPGPSMLYVLSRTLNSGWKAGLASSVGLAIGGVLLAIVAALGLTALFHTSETLYIVVKWMGAAYLCYLGYQIIRSSAKGASKTQTDDDKQAAAQVLKLSYQKIVFQGIWVELLNPKTILFFASFIPQFVDPALGNITLQMLILGILVPLTAIPSDLIVSVSAGTITDRLHRNPAIHRSLDFASASCLVGIGVHLVWS